MGDGYLVRIDHGNGFETYYGHTSKIYVTVGQKVAKGEKLQPLEVRAIVPVPIFTLKSEKMEFPKIHITI